MAHKKIATYATTVLPDPNGISSSKSAFLSSPFLLHFVKNVE